MSTYLTAATIPAALPPIIKTSVFFIFFNFYDYYYLIIFLISNVLKLESVIKKVLFSLFCLT